MSEPRPWSDPHLRRVLAGVAGAGLLAVGIYTASTASLFPQEPGVRNP